MNALMESAKAVDTAWCKGSLRKEASSRDEGNTYCAAGLLIKNIAQSKGLDVSWESDVVGPNLDMSFWDTSTKWYDQYMDYDGNWEDYARQKGVKVSLQFLNETTEARLLAETIMANYEDRVSEARELEYLEKGMYGHVIFHFNDHKDTTREDVVAMMEKAGLSMEDQIAFEDKTSDDLVAEIDELLNA